MCDTTPVRNWLLAAFASLLLAVAAIAVAAVLNASFWEAHKAPAAMLVAAGFTAAAMGASALAISSLDGVCTCLDARCQGQCASLRANIYAILTVLGIQATASVAAVWPAAIPLAGLPPMKVIAGALIVQSALLLSAAALVAMLDECAARAAAIINTPGGMNPGQISLGLGGRFRWRFPWRRNRR